MKKPILVLASLLMFAGIASASVGSDSMQVRYQKCIEDLSKLESVHYVKPQPQDFVSTGMKSITYDQAISAYNNQLATLAKKQTECKSLSGITISSSSKSGASKSTISSAEGTYQIMDAEDVLNHSIAVHPTIKHIEKTLNQFWILFGLVTFLLLVITWKVFRKEK